MAQDSPFEVPTPRVDTSTYAMPFFATLSVTDLETSTRWYVDGLDFVVLAQLPGLPHLRRWRYQDVHARSPHRQRRRGRFASRVRPRDAIWMAWPRAREHGGGTVEGPVITPWNTRDLMTRDPDGFTLVFTRLAPPNEQRQKGRERLEQGTPLRQTRTGLFQARRRIALPC